MSGIELNKVIAAILLASLIAMIVGTVANILYKPNLESNIRGYQIEVAEDEEVSSQVAAENEVIDIEKLMLEANAENGANIVKKCVSCHTFNNGGGNKVGPNLWNILNSPKGKHPGFAYSKVLANAEGKWDYESIFSFLKKPSKYFPGTKMSFAGLKKPEDIADVVAYLKERAS